MVASLPSQPTNVGFVRCLANWFALVVFEPFDNAKVRQL